MGDRRGRSLEERVRCENCNALHLRPIKLKREVVFLRELKLFEIICGLCGKLRLVRILILFLVSAWQLLVGKIGEFYKFA